MTDASKIDAELFSKAAILVNAYLLNKHGVAVKFDLYEHGVEMRVIGARNLTYHDPKGDRPSQIVVKIGGP